MSVPFVWKNQLTLSWRPFENKHLDRLRPYNGFANLGIALADLGVGIGTAYGWNQDRVGFAASLTKIAAMYAAFQLQASLQKVPNAGALPLADLEKQLKNEWRPELNKNLPAKGAKGDFPQLAKIFVPKDAGFPFSPTFQKNLEGMIGPSKNAAAAHCIRAIGFDYLAAALVYGGFYSLADGRGLWLSGDYMPTPDGAPAPGVTTIAEPTQRHQVATAAAVTLFMANLGGKQLISDAASQAMQSLMTNSYAARRLGTAAGGANRVVGKLGIQPNNVSFHDCAIVERHCMRYTLTTLFMPHGVQFDLFTELDSIADELFDKSRAACHTVHQAASVIRSLLE